MEKKDIDYQPQVIVLSTYSITQSILFCCYLHTFFPTCIELQSILMKCKFFTCHFLLYISFCEGEKHLPPFFWSFLIPVTTCNKIDDPIQTFHLITLQWSYYSRRELEKRELPFFRLTLHYCLSLTPSNYYQVLLYFKIVVSNLGYQERSLFKEKGNLNSHFQFLLSPLLH